VGTGDVDGGEIFGKNGKDVPHDGPNEESWKGGRVQHAREVDHLAW